VGRVGARVPLEAPFLLERHEVIFITLPKYKIAPKARLRDGITPKRRRLQHEICTAFSAPPSVHSRLCLHSVAGRGAAQVDALSRLTTQKRATGTAGRSAGPAMWSTLKDL
jgi:hypothetical protein